MTMSSQTLKNKSQDHLILCSRIRSFLMERRVLTGKLVRSNTLMKYWKRNIHPLLQPLYNSKYFTICFRKRHMQEVVSVYVITAFSTMLPIIFNYLSYETYDKCGNWRPRFGENKCFYSGMIFEKDSFTKVYV